MVWLSPCCEGMECILNMEPPPFSAKKSAQLDPSPRGAIRQLWNRPMAPLCWKLFVLGRPSKLRECAWTPETVG